MRELIKQQLEVFSQLKPPFTNEAHDILFKNKPSTALHSTDTKLSPYLDLLNTIYTQLDLARENQQLLDTISESKQKQTQYQKDQQALKSDLKACEERLDKLNEAIPLLYQKIEAQDAAAQSQQNNHDPLQATFRLNDKQNQMERTKQLLHNAKTDLQDIIDLQERIQLCKECGEQDSHIQQLKNYGVIVSIGDIDGYRRLENVIKEDIDFFSTLRGKLHSCQQDLAYYLGTKNLKDNLQKLTDSLATLKQRHTQALREIDNARVPDNEKIKLKDRYRQSSDPSLLISDTIHKKEALTSYSSPSAWINWGIYNQNYQQEYKSLESDIEFFKLLEYEANLQAKIAATNESIQQLSHSVERDQNPSSSFKECQRISMETLDVCYQKCGTTKNSDHVDISTTDMLATVIEMLSYIDAQAAKKNEAKKILKRLIVLNQSITQLCVKHEIIESDEEDTLTQLEEQYAEKKEMQAFLSKMTALCTSYLEISTDYDDFAKKLNHTKASISKLEHLINQNKKQLQKLEREDIVRQKISYHNTAIQLALEKILALGPLQDVSPEDLITQISSSDDNLITPRAKDTPDHADEYSFKKWQMKIASKVGDIPDELKAWYEDLSQALDNSNYSRPDSLRACQLLRDIYFELKYPENPHYPVLVAYQKNCSNPNQCLGLFLAQKPAFLPGKEDLYNLQDKAIRAVILKLYEKSKKLETSHPVEAKLLHQATQSIHQSALLLENNKGGEFMDYSYALLNDPRYNRLKRHRGFLKIWEGIETFFTRLISKITQAPTERQKDKFCFFKTKSVLLLEEAEKAVGNLSAQQHQAL